MHALKKKKYIKLITLTVHLKELKKIKLNLRQKKEKTR